MKKFIRSATALVVVVFGIGVWLSAQLDSDSDREEPQISSTMETPRATEYRGVNVVLETITQGDLEILAGDWNANLVRVHLGVEYGCGYFALQEIVGEESCCSQTDLERLDWLLDACEALGVSVLIDLVQFPGYHYIDRDDYTLWTSPSLQDQLIAFWRGIAQRYAGRGDVIYGYDLLNEPRRVSPATWNQLTHRITAAIREVDSNHAIVIECAEYAEPYGFSSLMPTGDENTIYSFHLWEPGEFTDQGRPGRAPIGAEWPSQGADREFLNSRMQPVLEFQKRYDVPVVVGEFGVSVWASPESRAAYLADAIDLFEEYGFDYVYWAYRAWPDFSLEHIGYVSESGRPKAAYVGDTPALRLIRQYFSRNSTALSGCLAEKPICVFDSSHWGREAEELRYLADIAWQATSQFKASTKRSGRITPEELEGIGLLVTGNPYGGKYSSDEVTAIVNFVRAGGSLLIYVNSGMPEDWVNPLLMSFGISYSSAQVRSSSPFFEDEDDRNFWIVSFDGTHPVGIGATSYYVTFGGSFDVCAPALPIGTTDTSAWRDVNGDGLRDFGEESGPLAIIAAAELGLGRVVAFGDDFFSSVCNAKLLVAAIAWLAR